MKRLIMAVVATVAFYGAINAQAMTKEEAAVVAKVSNEYLSAVPASGYHILAETVLDRIESKKNDFVIIDVRMPKADKYDKGHVPGAIYMGFREIANPENLAKLPKDVDLIVYCDTGHEQNKVLSVLRMLGYRAFDMKWGYSSWKVAGPTGATLKAIEGSISNDYPVQK